MKYFLKTFSKCLLWLFAAGIALVGAYLGAAIAASLASLFKSDLIARVSLGIFPPSLFVLIGSTITPNRNSTIVPFIFFFLGTLIATPIWFILWNFSQAGLSHAPSPERMNQLLQSTGILTYLSGFACAMIIAKMRLHKNPNK